MHVTIRRYSIHPGSTQRLIDLINEEFLPTISQAPKFIAYYAVDEGDGDISAVSIFEDEQSALASNHLAAAWVMKNVAALISQPPKIISGEVVAMAESGMAIS
ncbi:hypothetical protein [Verrucomicrobium sp. BvORR034]|jgi:hypothetical protein|uniref:hypothetical protein n=1 Tax=Verrucomicrobium sp. BvORR034 TaxID=1396418 RepID=UPI0007C82D06|nr:hypothetical protein [Verrucomicrobium sp. BvORR034]